MPSSPQTLTAALDERRDSEQSVSFIESAEATTKLLVRDLRSRALELLSALKAAGLARGDFLILANSSNQAFLEAFWACLYGGIVVAPVSIGATQEHRAKILRVWNKLGRPSLLLDETGAERLRKYSEDAVSVEKADNWSALEACFLSFSAMSENARRLGPAQAEDVGLDDLAFLQFSSGSTRQPKGVQLTHRNVFANSIDIGSRGQYHESDVALNWMPLTHDMGLIAFHVALIVHGLDHYIMPTELFTRRPRLWLDKASEVGATILGSPNFGYRHCLRALRARGANDGMDLSLVKLLLNGAEPVSVHLCREFNRTLAGYGLSPDAMSAAYGLAEASVGVGYGAPEDPLASVVLSRERLSVGDRVVELREGDDGGVEFALCGKPFDQTELRVVDEAQQVVEDGIVGHLQIRGDNVTAGYYDDRGANEAALVGDGWLDTGDLGLFLGGQIVVTGRQKDVIFVHGQNYYPHDLEAAVLETGEFQLGKVVAAAVRRAGAEHDEVTVFLQHRGKPEGFPDLATRISRSINESIGIEVHRVVPVRHIPRTTSGKIQRHRLVAGYVAGEFDDLLQAVQRVAPDQPTTEIASIDEDSLIGELQAICRDVLEGRQLGPNDNFFEIGISSLDLVQIVAGIDDRHPNTIDVTDLLEHPTLKELAGLLNERLAAETVTA